MDPSQVKRVKEEQHKGLLLCLEKLKRWEKFKTDYEALRQRLETLPDSLSYDITVPFGTNAFTMGKLVHTNEVMVLLGDNWFAEVSAKEAAAIANRRIAHCLKMLDALQKEKQQFENWLKYIDEVSGDDNLVEIVEKYDEEEEKKWKEQHAKNVKAYRKKIAEDKALRVDKELNNSDEECLAKLKNLEVNEGFLKEEESDKSTNECSANDYSDDTSQHSEDNYKPPLKLFINSNTRRSFSESETGDDIEDNSKRKDSDANLSSECGSPGGSKHVRWVDLSKQHMKKITFKHSKSKKQHHPNHDSKNQDSQSESEDHPQIQSPSDIYKYFGSYFQMSPPKSILKVKHSPTTDSSENFFPRRESVPKESSPDTTDESVIPAFTGEVFERSSPVHIVQNKSSRPSSHFKNSRKNRKH